MSGTLNQVDSSQSFKSISNMVAKNNQQLAAAVGGPMFFEMFGGGPAASGKNIKKVLQGNSAIGKP